MTTYFSTTINTPTTAVALGENVGTARWPSGFNHAALVTAGRSRSDGYDLYLIYQGQPVTMTSMSGVNTSACKIAFNAPATVNTLGLEVAYVEVHFGDLGLSTAPSYGSAGSACASDITITAGAVPSLTLPSPGFPLGRVVRIDVDELRYPEVRTPARSLRNENNPRRWSLNWSNVNPEDWYEIRLSYETAMGVGTVTVPQLVTDDGTAVGYRVLPGSLRVMQESRLKRSASLEIEEVFV